jgi:hypothetical protein
MGTSRGRHGLIKSDVRNGSAFWLSRQQKQKECFGGRRRQMHNRLSGVRITSYTWQILVSTYIKWFFSLCWNRGSIGNGSPLLGGKSKFYWQSSRTIRRFREGWERGNDSQFLWAAICCLAMVSYGRCQPFSFSRHLHLSCLVGRR